MVTGTNSFAKQILHEFVLVTMKALNSYMNEYDRRNRVVKQTTAAGRIDHNQGIVLTGKSCPDGRMSMAGKKHPITGIVFDSKGYPIFTSLYDMNLLPEDYTKTRNTHFRRASKDLYREIQTNPKLKSMFTDTEIELFRKGKVPARVTWHHNQSSGKMQLVDFDVHDKTYHKGGFSYWGRGNKKRA